MTVKGEGLADLLERGKAGNVGRDYRNKADKCISLSVRFLADSHLLYAQDITEPYEIIEKLDRVYFKSVTASRRTHCEDESCKHQSRNAGHSGATSDVTSSTLQYCGRNLGE